MADGLRPTSGGVRRHTARIERSEIAKGRSLCPKGSAGGRWQLADLLDLPAADRLPGRLVSGVRGEALRHAQPVVERCAVGGVGLWQKLRDLVFEPEHLRGRVAVAHGAVSAGIGEDLGAVERQGHSAHRGGGGE